MFTRWRQYVLLLCRHRGYHVLLRGKAAEPTCVIIVYVYIINMRCYFLHFHFILFCYYLHFDVLLLCKHLTAFLVVVARQKQGGRASDRAAASAAPESESAPEEGGLLCTRSFSDSEEGNRTDYSKLTTSYSESADTDLRHWNSCTGVQRWDKDKDWDKDSRTSNCNTTILNVQNEDHGQLAAGGQRHQGLELGGAHQRLRLGRAVTSWKQEHTTSTTTYTDQDYNTTIKETTSQTKKFRALKIDHMWSTTVTNRQVTEEYSDHHLQFQ